MMNVTKIDDAVKLINQHNDYKLIKRYQKITHYNEENDENKFIGIFLDTETTGASYQNDYIIEIALVPFEYSLDGRIFKILESYCEFQDPKKNIPKFITELTGITNEMVAGKSINIDKINELVESASIIIAHNAAFDRKFVEKKFPIFKNKIWGCTCVHIPWRKESITSAKLEYIAYKFGVFYDAHRAEIDCLIGIHALSQKLPMSNELALKVLLDNVKSKYFRIWAEGAPFDSKDILKHRRYRWNVGNDKPKAWYKDVSESKKDIELEFLFKKIYQKKVELKIDEISSFDYFSGR
jgi:DNA polymerase-3 subunit epsilon